MAVALPALLLLAACAPTTAGRASSSPITVGTEPVPVRQGETVYLRLDYGLDDFDLEPNSLTPALWVPSGYSSEVGEVTTYFALDDVDVAEGWTVELLQAKLERRVTVTSASFNTTSTSRSLWAVLEVSVPDDIVPGVYRVRGTLRARGGGNQPVAFRLDVAP